MPKGHYKRKSVPLETRFWRYVVKAQPDQCWLWTGVANQMGHGRICAEPPSTKYLGAHRVSYEIHNGPIPPGLSVLHKCDNPPCVNPAHLFLGTQKDNAMDAARKGRTLKGQIVPHPNSGGERCHLHKLTESQVREIRQIAVRDVTRTYSNIAAQFGVDRGTIRFIVSRQTWRHVL